VIALASYELAAGDIRTCLQDSTVGVWERATPSDMEFRMCFRRTFIYAHLFSSSLSVFRYSRPAFIEGDLSHRLDYQSLFWKGARAPPPKGTQTRLEKAAEIDPIFAINISQH